jgi:hypothetical protein
MWHHPTCVEWSTSGRTQSKLCAEQGECAGSKGNHVVDASVEARKQLVRTGRRSGHGQPGMAGRITVPIRRTGRTRFCERPRHVQAGNGCLSQVARKLLCGAAHAGRDCDGVGQVRVAGHRRVNNRSAHEIRRCTGDAEQGCRNETSSGPLRNSNGLFVYAQVCADALGKVGDLGSEHPSSIAEPLARRPNRPTFAGIATIAEMTAAFSSTPIVLSGPLRAPAQMLANQSYSGHKSVHDADSAAALGLAGAPIEGPTHFSQFEPLGAALWGERWFSHGCISAHFQNMVVEGEQVRAQIATTGPGVTTARMDSAKEDGTPVLTGTLSVGPHHGATELSGRLATAAERAPGELYVIDQMHVGQRDSGEDVVCMEFDLHLGNLYPFTLREKLALITEQVTYHQPDANTPWGAPVVPFEMLSVLTNAFAKPTFVARQPSVGLFIDLEVRMLAGPVLVGHPYRVQRELVAMGASKRTESYWTRSTLFDGTVAVAEVLLHQGVFKASYPGYPGERAPGERAPEDDAG